MTTHSDFTHTMKIGGPSLKLSFEEAVSDGYRWSIKDSDGLRIVYRNGPPAAGSTISAPGKAEFLIDYLDAGTHKVTFQRKRDGEAEPVETRTYSITVQP